MKLPVIKEGVILYLLVVIAIFSIFPAMAAQELRIALSISNSAQRAAYYEMLRAFELSHPNVKVDITSYTSEVYKAKFPQMLASNQFDVLYWHAGERLFEHIEQKKLYPLAEVLPIRKMSLLFDEAVIKLVSFDEKVYALPISYYQLGFYYNKPLFSKFGLAEPNTWQEFMALCEVLKQNNVTPIYIGTASNWPATAWFDYLNLRINGLDFHMRLMQGKISYLDENIANVLGKLVELNQAGYFIEDHQDLDWKQGLPLLFRGLTGMSMLGNYAIQDFPDNIINKIGFFKFPVIGQETSYFEEAPLDVLVMSHNAININEAKALFRFVVQSDVQEEFNKALGVLSPHKGAQQNNTTLVQEAYETISHASGISQYFDRDSKKEYADRAMPIIDEFMLNLDIENTQKALEKVRLDLFPSQFPSSDYE